MNDIKVVSMFMEEARKMGLDVLGPDINESSYYFTVNKAGAVRFGLGAIKGLGSSPVEAIISERAENGNYLSIFDFVRRISLRNCNKKSIESLAYAGGFDSFKGVTRSQLFKEDNNGRNFIEQLIRYGNAFQESENSSQVSLFGEGEAIEMTEPEIPKAEEWPSLFKLNKEKEVIGIFISGHPLDDYKLEISSFCNGNVAMLNFPQENIGKEILFAGIITEFSERISKKNTPYGIVVLEDYNDAFRLYIFGDDYQRFKPFFFPNNFVAIKGRFDIPQYRKEAEFRITSVERIQNLKDKMANDLHIRISNKQLDQLLISNLNNLFVENPGNCNLTFHVYDPLDKKMHVDMSSRNIRIDPTKEVIKKLDEMQLEFTLKEKR